MPSSTDGEGIQYLAVRLSTLITLARGPPARDIKCQCILSLAQEAGKIAVSGGQIIPGQSPTPFQTEVMPHARTAVAVPPILLSCAMALNDCLAPSCRIIRAPDWESIAYDDRRILSHPMHRKAVVWMAQIDLVTNVKEVAVVGEGINWQEIIHLELDQWDALGEQDGEVRTVPNHQPFRETEEHHCFHLLMF